MAEEYPWTLPNETIESMLGDREVFYSVDKPMNEVAIEGKAILVSDYDNFWGEGGNYRSDVVENPTWLDLALLADTAIRTTGDTHHQFFENIREVGEDTDGVSVYRFIMGS